MTALILEPTVTSQWQSLVSDAEKHCSLQLSEELESYLVFLLTRFATKPEMANSVLALDFLESLHTVGQKQLDQLRDVGDKCLLFAGFFPKRAERRRVKISYFVDLGKTSYSALADLSKQFADLYSDLCGSFVGLMDVLQAMREIQNNSQLLPLEALDLWESTGSQRALNILKQYDAEHIISNYRNKIGH